MVRAGHGDNTGSSTLANIYNINIIYNLQKVSPPHPAPLNDITACRDKNTLRAYANTPAKAKLAI